MTKIIAVQNKLYIEVGDAYSLEVFKEWLQHHLSEIL